MQTNDGQSLEQLVRVIEGQLSPRGFVVESRQHVYNDTGVQIAEFDIVITGYVGSAPLTCLIECRDRPSEGPAPGSWIEQLIGRRSRFRFDKVMAVSSTGFSEGAIEAATHAGIQLRSMEKLTAEGVAHWLPSNAPLVVREGIIGAVRVWLDAGEVSQVEPHQIPSDQPILFVGDSNTKVSLLGLWRQLINRDSVWSDVPEGGPSVKKTVVAGDHLAESISSDFLGGPSPVAGVEFDATLRVYFPSMPLVQASEYSSTETDPDRRETYARLGRWKGGEDAVIKEMVIIGYPKASDPSSPDAAPGTSSESSGT